MEDIDWLDIRRRIATGDQAASEEVFDAYVERLLRLVESRLSPAVSRRVDADDVVQSVFRTFFRRLGSFRIERSRDLWRLLSAIAIYKVRKQANRHTAAMRDVRQEAVGPLEEARIPEPTPADAAAISEILQTFVAELSPLERDVFLMRLEGDSLASIGHRLQRSQRTVRRLVHRLQTRLFAALHEDAP